MSNATHINPISGRSFSADESAALSAAMKARRFAQPQWATYQQWKGTGRTVAKGEQGTAVTAASGFTWRVFNVAQLEGVAAAAARAPVARTASAPAAKVTTKAAPESKKVSARRSARAVTRKAQPGKVAPIATTQPARPVSQDVATPARVASLIRCNKWLALTDSEARGLVAKYPGRTHFDPDELAAIYGTADTSRQATFRRDEAKRWQKIRSEQERRNPAKIGKARTRAWLIFTGRPEEARAYGNRKPGSTPATQAAPVVAQPEPVPQPEPETTPAPAVAAAEPAAVESIPPQSWRERWAARFGIRRAA